MKALHTKYLTAIALFGFALATSVFSPVVAQEKDPVVLTVNGQEIRASSAPIVLITSNDEKDLPDAFLRRCLFHYIEFPKGDRLIEIVKAHFPTSPEKLVDAIIDRFLQLREEMRQDKGDAGKKVSTSELLDWVRVLSHYPEDRVLDELSRELLAAGVLLKSRQDYRRYRKP